MNSYNSQGHLDDHDSDERDHEEESDGLNLEEFLFYVHDVGILKYMCKVFHLYIDLPLLESFGFQM